MKKKNIKNKIYQGSFNLIYDIIIIEILFYKSNLNFTLYSKYLIQHFRLYSTKNFILSKINYHQIKNLSLLHGESCLKLGFKKQTIYIHTILLLLFHYSYSPVINNFNKYLTKALHQIFNNKFSHFQNLLYITFQKEHHFIKAMIFKSHYYPNNS